MTNKHALPQEKHHYSGLYDLHPHHCSIIAAAGSIGSAGCSGIGQDEIKVLGIVNYTTNSTR